MKRDELLNLDADLTPTQDLEPTFRDVLIALQLASTVPAVAHQDRTTQSQADTKPPAWAWAPDHHYRLRWLNTRNPVSQRQILTEALDELRSIYRQHRGLDLSTLEGKLALGREAHENPDVIFRLAKEYGVDKRTIQRYRARYRQIIKEAA